MENAGDPEPSALQLEATSDFTNPAKASKDNVWDHYNSY